MARVQLTLFQRDDCPLCDQEPETANHLLIGCIFAREVWYAMLRRCELQLLTPNPQDTLIDWWPQSRRRAPSQAKKGFDSLVLLVAWTLWKERNARVFEHKAETVGAVCHKIAGEVELWKLSGAVGLGQIWR